MCYKLITVTACLQVIYTCLSCSHSHENNVRKHIVSSYNWVQRESTPIGYRLGQDIRSIVPEYATNGSVLQLFDYINMYVYTFESNQLGKPSF